MSRSREWRRGGRSSRRETCVGPHRRRRPDEKETTMSIDVSGFKEGQKAMWTAGDYPEVSRRIASVAELLVERIGAGTGLDWLDVATGSGNVALPAARAGASVTGLDLTPKLLDV